MSLVIRGSLIIDGTGSSARSADILIEGDTIRAVGDVGVSAGRVIDAAGQVAAPGFIDIHSHTDHLLLVNPLADSKLLQGVTTEVGGNCGFSAAPLHPQQQQAIDQDLGETEEIRADWQGIGGFLNRLDSAGIGPNFATLAGHGNLRAQVMGYRAETANAVQRARMRAMAAQCLAEGALGISAGLIYPPGCYSNSEELAEVAGAAKGCGFFAAHIRDEGGGLLDAIEEMLIIARKSRVPVHISHLKSTGKDNWGLVKKGVDKIEAAREEGFDITADVYPYIATNTSLSAVLPDWMKEGGVEAMLQRLKNQPARAKWELEWGARNKDLERWDEYCISRIISDELKIYEGRRLGEICRILQADASEVLAMILSADKGQTEMMRFCMCEDDIEYVLKRPWTMIGSDAAAKTFNREWGHPHPRGFGTFPRILAEYVRKRNVLSLDEAIRKMTFSAAERLALHNRGKIETGYKADLVIFDPAAVSDMATYAEPAKPPGGISWVIVNGEIAAEAGCLTGRPAGRILIRQNL